MPSRKALAPGGSPLLRLLALSALLLGTASAYQLGPVTVEEFRQDCTTTGHFSGQEETTSGGTTSWRTHESATYSCQARRETGVATEPAAAALVRESQSDRYERSEAYRNQSEARCPPGSGNPCSSTLEAEEARGLDGEETTRLEVRAGPASHSVPISRCQDAERYHLRSTHPHPPPHGEHRETYAYSRECANTLSAAGLEVTYLRCGSEEREYSNVSFSPGEDWSSYDALRRSCWVGLQTSGDVAGTGTVLDGAAAQGSAGIRAETLEGCQASASSGWDCNRRHAVVAPAASVAASTAGESLGAEQGVALEAPVRAP